MNEEWLGIVSQSQEYYGGGGYYGRIHKRVPRAAYYVLGDIWKEDMFEISAEEIEHVFSKERNQGVSIADAVARANDIGVRERKKGLHAEWVTASLGLEGKIREHFGDVDDELDFSAEQTGIVVTSVEPSPNFGARMQLRFQYEAVDDVFQESYSYSLLRGAISEDKKDIAARRLP